MKNIILTGTSSGFGLITAKTLATQGHTVFATMRNAHTKNAAVAANLLQWAKDNKTSIEVIVLDVTDDDSVSKAVATIAEKTNGTIDVLINNAGAAFIGLNETLSAKQTDQIFQINVIAVDRMIKAVLPYMHQKKDGLLITISSVAARQHTPVMGTYAASKAAVDALSVSYAYELKSCGIDVAIIQPGAYPSTDIVTKQVVPANPNAESNYSANMIAYKQAVFKYFEPKETSPNPQEVADLIAALIVTPKGERPIWSLINGGPLGSLITNINTATKQLTDTILGARNVEV